MRPPEGDVDPWVFWTVALVGVGVCWAIVIGAILAFTWFVRTICAVLGVTG